MLRQRFCCCKLVQNVAKGSAKAGQMGFRGSLSAQVDFDSSQ